jgi:hypothetical protein
LQQEIDKYCIEHGISKAQLSLQIGYGSRQGFYEAIFKKRNSKGMKLEKWLSLSTLLNKSIEELIELYGSEVE